jgi:nucleolar protein 56
MKVKVCPSPIGLLAVDENGNLIAKRLFPKQPELIAQRILDRKEIESFTEQLKSKGYEIEIGRCDFRQFALKLGWAKDDQELNRIISAIAAAKTKIQLRKPKIDKIVIITVGILDQLDRDLNSYSERMREWWGLHFPEGVKAITSNRALVEIISKYGSRENIKEPKLAKLAKESAGMPLSDNDIEIVQQFATKLLQIFSTREQISKYIENLVKTIAPNCTAIAGHLLTARLIAHTGGLEKLAKLPASTIQLLGAEKALFRHLKQKTKVPKYGLIFGHPAVQQAPQELKGKIARLIAAKLALAAKIDFFSAQDRGSELKRELDEQIKKVLGFIS